MTIRNYILITAAIMVALLGIVWAFHPYFLPPSSYPWVMGAIALSAISAMVAYMIVYNGIERHIRLFATYVSGSMLLKMMIGIMAVTLVALKFKEQASPFVLSYFFSYFVFTSLEVYGLMRKLRPFSKNGRRETQDEKSNT